MPSKRRRDGITVRQEIQRAAVQLDVSVDELDRARILGQIAYFLSQHKQIGNRVAYKGGAVMKLVDKSPRFSADLDGPAVAGREVRQAWIEEALSTEEARRVVLAVSKIVNRTDRGIGYPVLECRAIAGQTPITVKLSINWLEPLLLAAEWKTIEIHGLGIADLPIVDRRERAAEKVRAFMQRGEVRDAHDLYHFDKHVLAAADWDGLVALVRTKLDQVGLLWGPPLRGTFDRSRARAQTLWPGTMVVEGGPPKWDEVAESLGRFSALLPSR